MAILVDVKRKAAVAFHSLVEANATQVAAALEHRLRAYLKEGEKLPDLKLVLMLLARLVTDLAGWLGQRHREHEDALGAGMELRARRDSVAEIVYRELVKGRALVRALFGRRRGSEILGLEGATAEAKQPDLLCRQGTTATRRLRDPELEATGAMRGFVFDPAGLARDLEPPVAALREALDDVERGQHRARQSLAARDGVLAELALVLKASALVMKGFFMLAGRSELAQRIDELLRGEKGRKGKEGRCVMKS